MEVIDIGIVVIGGSCFFPVSTTFSSRISKIGNLLLNNAATTAYEVASKRLPSALIILQSTKIV
jgi:Na+-translocating ferredoxin:NAD+ oxidoreductase RnfC subunit